MLSNGFKRSVNDLALYWKTNDNRENIFVLIYIDDTLIFAPKNSSSLTKIKEALSNEFEMKDMGELKSFLSIEVTWDRMNQTITLT